MKEWQEFTATGYPLKIGSFLGEKHVLNWVDYFTFSVCFFVCIKKYFNRYGGLKHYFKPNFRDIYVRGQIA